MTETQKKAALKMLSAGVDIAEIAADFGVPVTTLKSFYMRGGEQDAVVKPETGNCKWCGTEFKYPHHGREKRFCCRHCYTVPINQPAAQPITILFANPLTPLCIVAEEGTSVETIYTLRDYLLLSKNDYHELPKESPARKPLDNTTGYHYNILWLAETNHILCLRVSHD